MKRLFVAMSLILAACTGEAVDETVEEISVTTTFDTETTPTTQVELEELQEQIDEFEEQLEALPDCAVAGEILTDAMVDDGCWDGEELVFQGVWDCEDGRRLWGEDDLWSWVGEVVVKTDGDSAGDPAYAAAFAECTNS